MTAGLHRELHDRFGDRYSTAAAVRAHHGKDDSHHPPVPPDGVVFAESTEEVAFAVRACARHRTPVIPSGPEPRSRGTSRPCGGASRSTWGA